MKQMVLVGDVKDKVALIIGILLRRRGNGEGETDGAQGEGRRRTWSGGGRGGRRGKRY